MTTLTAQLILIFRILLAGICGAIIGIERKNRSKEAGIRTHFVVACGAALIMVISKYAFFDMIEIAENMGTEVRLDPSRIASTIASGIGFLGAGMIFVHKNTITGLTTAAGIWTTSGVGMAIGAGMYVIGIASTVIIVIAQIVLHMNFRLISPPKIKLVTIEGVTEEKYLDCLTKMFSEKGMHISEVSVERMQENERRYKFSLEMNDDYNEDDVISMINYKTTIKPKI